MKTLKLSLLLGLFAFIVGCTDDEKGVDITVSVDDFSTSISETPSEGDVLGSVTSNTNEGTVVLTLTDMVPAGAIRLNGSDIVVNDAAAFDADERTEVTATVVATNGTVSESASITIELENIDQSGPIVWTGETLTFTKTTETDPAKAENQDRLTDLVWITRGDKGQIYNAKTETEAIKASSPAGTAWAKGTTANLESLTFAAFRSTLDKPKDEVGTQLVMHLVEEDIYLDVTITAWEDNGGGAFTYERSTPQ